MMKMVGKHENIAVMLACVTLQQPYYMVLEYVANGDLLRYLRALRNVFYDIEGIPGFFFSSNLLKLFSIYYLVVIAKIQPSVKNIQPQGSTSSEAPLLGQPKKKYPSKTHNSQYSR